MFKDSHMIFSIILDRTIFVSFEVLQPIDKNIPYPIANRLLHFHVELEHRVLGHPGIYRAAPIPPSNSKPKGFLAEWSSEPAHCVLRI